MKAIFLLKDLFLILIVASFIFFLGQCSNSPVATENDTIPVGGIPNLFREEWEAPDINGLSEAEGETIRYGKELIVNTSKYLGPKGSVKHVSNGMNCQNCHLEAGTKLFANTFSAVFANYPKFRARSGTVENLVKRINDCMERSLNGEKLDSASKEMQSMIAYINWVGKDVKKNTSPKGAATAELPFLDREADPLKGESVFMRNCTSCHGNNGEGKMNDEGNAFVYPPLWGKDSYNVSAGMYRIPRLAGFIKLNMPNTIATKNKPLLTDEEAWDVAAYINSQARVEKFFKGDWPDLSKKPYDVPFGPNNDKFSERQHKYGPYAEMKK